MFPGAAGGSRAGELLAAEGEAPPPCLLLVELGLEGGALKAGELVGLLGGEAESMRALRLGFELAPAEAGPTVPGAEAPAAGDALPPPAP